MPRWRAVVLDLDDTLYPEEAYVRSGLRAVAARAQETLGIPAAEAEAELVALFERGARRDTFDRWLAARGLGGIPPGAAVYVSDNPAKDFLGARRAGMRSVRVRPAGGIYAALEPETPEYAPDAEVDGLGGVERALEG